MATLPVYRPDGTATTLSDDAAYTVVVTLPDGRQLSDTGVAAWQVRQAFERAAQLGMTIERVIKETPLSVSDLAAFTRL